MFYVGVAVLVAAIALTYAQLPPRTVGRYVVAQANGDFANVVWVLDTLTGEVAAHRLARSENAQGEFAGWVVEHDVSDAGMRRMLEALSSGPQRGEQARVFSEALARRGQEYHCRAIGLVLRILAGCPVGSTVAP